MKSEFEYFLDGKLNEECGVFGAYNIDEASQIVYYGLHSLQHRGQEGAGIASSDGENIITKKGEGLASEVFDSEKLSTLIGNMSVGHVRYSTSGGGGIENVQPLFIRAHTGNFVVAHNGNIVNTRELKMHLEAMGSIFHTTSDSEIIAHLIQREAGDFKEKILKALTKIEGAFSFIIMTKDSMYVIRDKNGFRPLAMGTLDNAYVFSSESSAFQIVGAKYLRDVEPAEVITLHKNNIEIDFYTDATQNKMCAMEYIYFSRPDTIINGLNVHTSRRRAGAILARECPVNADIVIGVPDSSLSSAMGYSDYSNIPCEMGLIKNRYVGRTFIKPSQMLRERGVMMKLSAMEAIVRDKNLILVDDSIVRGTTSRHIIKLLKNAGAKEIHVRITSSPIISPCFYGVDISNYDELISTKYNAKELADFIGADSLYFLSSEGMYEAMGKNICTACFTGKYPTSTFSLLDEIKNQK